jgi:hypothetical protein
MDCTRIAALLSRPIPPWEDGLARFLALLE